MLFRFIIHNSQESEKVVIFSFRKIIKTRGCGLTTLQTLPFFPGASRRNLKFASDKFVVFESEFEMEFLDIPLNLMKLKPEFISTAAAAASDINILRLTMKGPKASLSRLEKRIQIGAQSISPLA